MGGAGCVGRARPQIFRYHADQWTITAQDEGGWRKAAKQGAERFVAKLIAPEKARARLRHAVVVVVLCPNVKGRSKERIG